MTRERAAELWPIIKAYGDGRSIQFYDSDLGWINCKQDGEGYPQPTFEDSSNYEYRIKPEPKKRPMTRGEVLYMVTTMPGMVVRFMRDTNVIPYPAANFDWNESQQEQAEYAIIDASGEPIDGWHKFEKEVTE